MPQLRPTPIGDNLYSLTRRVKILEDKFASGDGAVVSVFGRGGVVSAQSGDYTWAQINKSTSSLADITTRSAADLSSGTLSDARLSSNVYIAGGTDVPVTDGGTGASDAATARTNLGLAVGVDVQGYDAELAALAGLTSAANKVPYFTGSGTAGLLDFKDEDNMASNSNTAVPSQQSVKAYVDTSVTGLLDFKGNLDASTSPNYPSASKGDAYYVNVAGKVGGASGKSVDVGDVVIASADNAGGTEASVGTSWFVIEHNLVGALLSSNNLSDVSSASTARSNLGLVIGTNVQAYDPELAALAGLASAADKLPYFTGSGTASVADFTSFGRSLIDDANAAAAIATLGLDADLATFSLPASTTISAFGASLIDDAAASNARTTLGLGTIATEAESGYALLAGRSGGQTLTGGTAASENLTLSSTSHGTKGYILMGSGGGKVGIGGVTTPISNKMVTISPTAAPTVSETRNGVALENAGDIGVTFKNSSSGVESYFGTRSGGFFLGTKTFHAVAFMVNDSEKMTLTNSGKLGINQNSPASGIDLNNSMSFKQVTDSTTSYTALDTDAIILMTNSAARTVNLPAASTRTGRIYFIVDGAGTATTAPITIDPNSTEQINGATTFNIDRNNGAAFIYCDGTGWRVISAPGTFGGGTVTSITAGTGLSGGTITGSGTIAIDSTVATLTGSQTLTNKTIDGDDNTLQDIGAGSLKFSGCEVTCSGDQTIANNGAIVTAWDTESYDTDGYHEGVTNPSRMTVPATGKYRVTATLGFAANATNRRGLQIYVGGSGVAQGRHILNATSTGSWISSTSALLNLSSGNYVEIFAYQDSGTNRTLTGSLCVFSIQRVA